MSALRDKPHRAQKGRGWRTFSRLVQAAVCLLVAGCVLRYVVDHWRDVAEVGRLSPAWLGLSLVFGALGCFGFAWVTRMVVGLHRYQVTLGAAVGLLYVPMLGKYVPGRIWTVLAALGVYARQGIPKRVAIRCLVIAMTVSLGSGAVAATILGGDCVSRYIGWSACIGMLAAFVAFAALAPAVVRLGSNERLHGKWEALVSVPGLFWLRSLGANIVVWTVPVANTVCCDRNRTTTPE